MMWVVPATIGIIFILLYFAFRRVRQPLIILLTLPFALVGGVWLIYVLGHAVSIATAVGFIALAGLAAEFGVVMLVYLDRAIEERVETGRFSEPKHLDEALMARAEVRVPTQAMTGGVIRDGGLALLLSTGHAT